MTPHHYDEGYEPFDPDDRKEAWPMPNGTYWPLLTEITPIPWWRRVWWKLFGRCDE